MQTMQSLWMVVSALFFAFYAAFVKIANIEGISSFQILFYRSVFGLLFFFVLMHVRGIVIQTRYPLHHAIRATIGTTSVLCGIYSISHLNLGLAMTLNYTSPLFIGLFSIIGACLGHRKINWKLIATLVIGFIGVITLLSPTISPSEYPAALIGLCAGLCTAIAVSYVKKLGMLGEPEERILFYFVLVGTIAGFFGTLLNGGFSSLSVRGAGGILGFMICSTLAQMCLTRSFSRGNIVLSGALQYSVILFSTLLGEIAFGDPVTVAIVIGMIIIVISGIAASFFTRQENTIAKNKLEKPKSSC